MYHDFDSLVQKVCLVIIFFSLHRFHEIIAQFTANLLYYFYFFFRFVIFTLGFKHARARFDCKQRTLGKVNFESTKNCKTSFTSLPSSCKFLKKFLMSWRQYFYISLIVWNFVCRWSKRNTWWILTIYGKKNMQTSLVLGNMRIKIKFALRCLLSWHNV